MNAYRSSDLVREANYATGNRLNVAAHLAHLYGINCRQFGPDRVIADGHDLMRLPLSGWYERPEGPALSAGTSRWLPRERGSE